MYHGWLVFFLPTRLQPLKSNATSGAGKCRTVRVSFHRDSVLSENRKSPPAGKDDVYTTYTHLSRKWQFLPYILTGTVSWLAIAMLYLHQGSSPLGQWKRPGFVSVDCYAMESSPNGSFALLLGLLGVFSAPLRNIYTLNLNSSIHNTQWVQNVCWASWCLLTYCSAEAQSQKRRGWFHLFSSLKAEGVKETARLKQWLGKIQYLWLSCVVPFSCCHGVPDILRATAHEIDQHCDLFAGMEPSFTLWQCLKCMVWLLIKS